MSLQVAKSQPKFGAACVLKGFGKHNREAGQIVQQHLDTILKQDYGQLHTDQSALMHALAQSRGALLDQSRQGDWGVSAQNILNITSQAIQQVRNTAEPPKLQISGLRLATEASQRILDDTFEKEK